MGHDCLGNLPTGSNSKQLRQCDREACDAPSELARCRLRGGDEAGGSSSSGSEPVESLAPPNIVFTRSCVVVDTADPGFWTLESFTAGMCVHVSCSLMAEHRSGGRCLVVMHEAAEVQRMTKQALYSDRTIAPCTSMSLMMEGARVRSQLGCALWLERPLCPTKRDPKFRSLL